MLSQNEESSNRLARISLKGDPFVSMFNIELPIFDVWLPHLKSLSAKKGACKVAEYVYLCVQCMCTRVCSMFSFHVKKSLCKQWPQVCVEAYRSQ